jgi:hypothetical protein
VHSSHSSPGYDESQITIISTCPAPEVDYVQQTNRDQIDSGIVHLQLKNNSNPFKWSKICWIKFQFDNDFNPVLWLANDTYSLKL